MRQAPVSQTHQRKRKASPRKSGWGDLFLTVIVALAIDVIIVSRMLPGFGFRTGGRETAMGKVLETRIVIYSTQDSSHGGIIFYRIEAHAAFNVNGDRQDRWIPASEANSSREELQLRVSPNPENCMVSWPPRHPENDLCSLK